MLLKIKFLIDRGRQIDIIYFKHIVILGNYFDKIIIDPETQRLVGSAKIERYLQPATPSGPPRTTRCDSTA